MSNLSAKDLLEQMQTDRKYCLSPEQVEELCKNFGADYSAEVMIELGHNNKEIHEATGVNECRISWMRVKYSQPPKRTELELRHKEINLNYVHSVGRIEDEFCKLFRCGHHHKDHKQLTARVIRR